jgi:copper resistance protein B
MRTLALTACVAFLAASPHEARAQEDHAAMGHDSPPATPREPIPVLTDEDRKAAFPSVAGHAVHDDGIHWLSQLDRLEARDADEGSAFAWEARGWVGTDLDRLWWRTEGESVDDETEQADAELLYGRSITPWWDVVAGVRHDFAPDDDRTWLALGVAGLAPYKFDLEVTAYVGDESRTAARLELDYELLLTNRLILQPRLELNGYGKADEERNIGSGLSVMEAGLRVRYEITRRFAPYVGIVYERAFSGTADLRRAAGQDEDDTQLLLGVRAWF